MKKILLSILIIVAIEFNFTTWSGFWNAPNWVVAYDEAGNRVELFSSWKVEPDGKFYWHIETLNKEYQWDLNFWETR